MLVVVGSTSPVKVKASQRAFDAFFEDVESSNSIQSQSIFTTIVRFSLSDDKVLT